MTDEKSLSRRERRKLVKERRQKWGKESLSHNKSTEEFREEQVAYEAEKARRKAAFEALPPEEQARIRAEQRGREARAAQVVTSMVALTCPEEYYGRRGRSQ